MYIDFYIFVLLALFLKMVLEVIASSEGPRLDQDRRSKGRLFSQYFVRLMKQLYTLKKFVSQC
jgi:hypothetical protein